MKLRTLQRHILRGARRYEKETGEAPHVYSIEEHWDDSKLLTIHFSRTVEYSSGGYSKSAMTPHLNYSFDPSGESPPRYRWDGLVKWRKREP